MLESCPWRRARLQVRRHISGNDKPFCYFRQLLTKDYGICIFCDQNKVTIPVMMENSLWFKQAQCPGYFGYSPPYGCTLMSPGRGDRRCAIQRGESRTPGIRVCQLTRIPGGTHCWKPRGSRGRPARRSALLRLYGTNLLVRYRAQVSGRSAARALAWDRLPATRSCPDLPDREGRNSADTGKWRRASIRRTPHAPPPPLFPWPCHNSPCLLVRVDSTSAIQMPMTLWDPSAFWIQDSIRWWPTVFITDWCSWWCCITYFCSCAWDGVYLYCIALCSPSAWPKWRSQDLPISCSGPCGELEPILCCGHHPLNMWSSAVYSSFGPKQDVLYPRFAKGLYALSATGAVCSILSFFLEYHLIDRLGVILAIIACCVALYVVYYTWLVGRHHSAKFFAIAWTVFLTGCSVWPWTNSVWSARFSLNMLPKSAQRWKFYCYPMHSRRAAQWGQQTTLSCRVQSPPGSRSPDGGQQEKLRTQTELALRLNPKSKYALPGIAGGHALSPNRRIGRKPVWQPPPWYPSAAAGPGSDGESIGLNLEDPGRRQVGLDAHSSRYRSSGGSFWTALWPLQNWQPTDTTANCPVWSPGASEQIWSKHCNPCQSAEVRLDLVLPDQTGWIRTDPLMLKRCLIILADNAETCRQYFTDPFTGLRPRGAVFTWRTMALAFPHRTQTRFARSSTRSRNPERNRKAGLGLGLSLCKRLCELKQPAWPFRQPGSGQPFSMSWKVAHEFEGKNTGYPVALESGPQEQRLKILVRWRWRCLLAWPSCFVPGI